MKRDESRDLPPKGGSYELGPKGGSYELGREGGSHGLQAGLRAVAEDDERLGTSGAVGLRLLAEVQAIGAGRRRRTLILSLSAAAAVLIGVLVPTWRLWQSAADQPRQADAPVVTRELVTEFFPLGYSNVPARGGYVVRMQVPRSALASFGIALTSNDASSSGVLADVVVGDDGLARAVRFVRVVNSNGQEQRP
jgi:hypothetical protein